MSTERTFVDTLVSAIENAELTEIRHGDTPRQGRMIFDQNGNEVSITYANDGPTGAYVDEIKVNGVHVDINASSDPAIKAAVDKRLADYVKSSRAKAREAQLSDLTKALK